MKSISVLMFGLLVVAGCSTGNVKPQAEASPKDTELQQIKTAETVSDKQQMKSENAAAEKHSVYFKFDKSDLNDADRAVLESNAKSLREHPAAKIVIQGNTDERGSSEYNLALGQRRAVSTKKALGVLGVKNGNMEVSSLGELQPKALCHDESCWSENRRADIVYSSVNPL